MAVEGCALNRDIFSVYFVRRILPPPDKDLAPGPYIPPGPYPLSHR